MIKPIILVFLIMFGIFPAFGQERKNLVVGVSGGKLVSPYYLKNASGRFYNIDFDYYLSKRHILSINYLGGEHHYYDNVLSTDPTYHRADGTNAEATYHTFSIVYKYQFLNSKRIAAALGAGAGIMTHSRTYPFLISNGSNFKDAVWSDLVFPVRLEFDYELPQNFRIGIIGGFFVHPDFPVLAYHVGPRLSYVIK